MTYQLTLGDYVQQAKRRKVVVSFAGIGGTCRGLAQAGLEPGDAINHSRIALAIHRANHPRTRHHIEDLLTENPKQARLKFVEVKAEAPREAGPAPAPLPERELPRAVPTLNLTITTPKEAES